MASPLYTNTDLGDALRGRSWDEVQRIIRAQPQLVNERYLGVTLLWRIVTSYEAKEHIVLQSLQFAERETVDDLNEWPFDHRSILCHLACHGHTEALRRALQISTTHLNLQDTFGDTPLHILLQANHSFPDHRDAAQTLIYAGANSDLENKRGLYPVDMYTRNNCWKYEAENREKQKEHIVQLLHRKIIPVEILARGAEALKAFNKAREEGEVEVNQGRNIFMGLERVGKTSTINSFLRKDFNPGEEITDAMARTKVCTQDAVDETLWEETSHDNSGVAGIYEDALVEAMAKQVLEKDGQEADEAAVGTTGIKHHVTSVTQTVKNVLFSKYKREEKTSVVDKQGSSSQEKEPDVERKQEKQQKRPTEEVPENIASKVEERIHEIKFPREAASECRKSGSDFLMNICDFGGQPIYHVIQRIFIVSFAVVCVVFNLEDDLDSPAYVRDPTTGEMYQHRMTNLQFILYWIRSVFTNSRDSKMDDGQLSPPVLLIGTHLHSLEGNEEEKKNKAKEIFSKIRQALEGKPYEAMVFSTFFAIENSLSFSKSNASNIMNQILKFAKKMVRILPLTWLLVQQEIQKLKEKHIYLPTIEVIALVDRCGVKHDAQRVLLEYLHDIGEILYFPDDEALMDIIVLDLMRIVDMFKTIITVIDPELQEPLLKEAWRKLDLGILEEHLLRHLWKKFHVSDETFDFFVSLMQRFGLICERTITKGDGRIFYVLSRLKPERVDSLPADDYGKRAVSIFHDFGGYLPDDVFQRGVTKFIERFQIEDSEPTLAYEHVELDIDELHHVVLDVANIKHRRMFQTTIIRRKILKTDAEEAEPLPSVCKEVLRFLEAELKIFCQSGARGVELRMYIPCVCSPNIRDAHLHIVRNFDKDVLPCGSNGMEVTRYRRLFGDNEPRQAVPQSQPAVAKPEGFVDDAIIATVSEEMDLSWRRFGVRLGLKWSKVNQFNADERQIGKAVENMMKFWRNNIGSERHQLKALYTALRQHRFNRLADELFRGDIGDKTLVITEQTDSFEDQDLLFICDNLGPGWRRLGVRLGLKWTDISYIADNNRQVKDSIMESLVTWRDGQSTNQMPIMLNALDDQELVQLAERVGERHGYKEEHDAQLKQVTVSKIQSQCTQTQGDLTDVDFLMISEMMDGDWKSLGRNLRIAEVELIEIERKFPTQIVESTLETLVRWRNKQGRRVDQLRDIKTALTKMEKMHIVEKLDEKYQ